MRINNTCNLTTVANYLSHFSCLALQESGFCFENSIKITCECLDVCRALIIWHLEKCLCVTWESLNFYRITGRDRFFLPPIARWQGWFFSTEKSRLQIWHDLERKSHILTRDSSHAFLCDVLCCNLYFTISISRIHYSVAKTVGSIVCVILVSFDFVYHFPREVTHDSFLRLRIHTAILSLITRLLTILRKCDLIGQNNTQILILVRSLSHRMNPMLILRDINLRHANF